MPTACVRVIRPFILALAAVIAVFAAGDGFAKCAPHRTIRIVMRVDDPGLPADHFARRPKTMYRLGEKYGRIEEELNPGTGSHLLIVVNEPDLWMVNRADKTGRHAVDAGPTYAFRAPLFGHLKSEYWENLEFGCEVAFMQAVKAAPRTDETGTATYEHTAEGATATLVVSKSGMPQRVALRNGDGNFAYVYDVYEQLDNADTALFAKPEGITFTEMEEEGEGEP